MGGAVALPGWTVRDVVAHLVIGTRGPILSTVVRVVRARWDFDRVTAETAREWAAAYRPVELVSQLRESAGSSRRFPLSGELDPLADVLVHGQDIARPLGRTRRMPAHRAVAALRHVWGSVFYGNRKRFAGLRLVATDADWSSGPGAAQVSGPVGDLLLLATGRPAGLAGLTGDGVAEVGPGCVVADRCAAVVAPQITS